MNIGSITSVQVVLKARINERSKTYTIRTQLIDQGGNTLYTEDLSGSSTGTYTTHTGTARTTSNGSNAWIDGVLGLDGLRLLIRSQTLSGGTLRMTYAYVIVTYEEAGYGNNVLGVDSGDILKVNGIASENISKVNGV